MPDQHGDQPTHAVIKRPAHRPCSYTSEVGRIFCDAIADGWTTRQIFAAHADILPEPRTVFRWLWDTSMEEPALEQFRQQYQIARDIRAERMAEQIEEIADDSRNDWMERERQDGRVETIANAEHILRSRLRVDTRKWLMARMLPKKYGDRTAVDLTATLTLAAAVEDMHRAREQRQAEAPIDKVIEYDGTAEDVSAKQPNKDE